jgi:transcriptional regulator with PAS, ATPase and Fis domain
MKEICAWCGVSLKESDDTKQNGLISHGICSKCAIKLGASECRSIKELLDLIKEPVFLVDKDGKVQSANEAGLKLLGKKLSDIHDSLGGKVFECEHASEEGGCGNTIHCKGCTIRNTVMKTLESGVSQKNIPAFQLINTPEGITKMWFLISTEKVNETVLLRIDGVAPA